MATGTVSSGQTASGCEALSEPVSEAHTRLWDTGVFFATAPPIAVVDASSINPDNFLSTVMRGWCETRQHSDGAAIAGGDCDDVCGNRTVVAAGGDCDDVCGNRAVVAAGGDCDDACARGVGVVPSGEVAGPAEPTQALQTRQQTPTRRPVPVLLR
jgi:hypothetical protein